MLSIHLDFLFHCKRTNGSSTISASCESVVLTILEATLSVVVVVLCNKKLRINVNK